MSESSWMSREERKINGGVVREGQEENATVKAWVPTTTPGSWIQTVSLTTLMPGNIYLAEPNKQCKESHLSNWHSKGPQQPGCW